VNIERKEMELSRVFSAWNERNQGTVGDRGPRAESKEIDGKTTGLFDVISGYDVDGEGVGHTSTCPSLARFKYAAVGGTELCALSPHMQ
jgi:hypothetical protein